MSAANWADMIFLACVVFPMWISTGQLPLAVLAMDFGLITFYYNIPAVAWPFIAIMNVLFFTVTLLWRPMTPYLTS